VTRPPNARGGQIGEFSGSGGELSKPGLRWLQLARRAERPLGGVAKAAVAAVAVGSRS